MSRTNLAILLVFFVLSAPRPALAQHGHDHPAATQKVAPEKPSSDQAARSSASARSASSGRNAAARELGTAIARIQERIATETGPQAKAASGTTAVRKRVSAEPAPRTVVATRTAPQPAAASQKRLVTLRWRITLDWPADLAVAPVLPPSSKIDLKW